MSTVKVNAITDASGGNTATINSMTPTADSLQGFRNRIINGNFAVAQRGTSFTSTGSANNDDTYNLDRWYVLSDGNDVIDITQATDVPTGAKYSIGLDVETVNKKFGIAQIIENINCFDAIGGNVTLSFKARVTSTSKLDNVKCAVVAWSGTADSVTSDIISAWGVEGTNPTLIANATYENSPANLNVTTSWATYSVSAAVDTASTSNIIVFIWSDVTDTTLGDFLYITGVQLEVGSVAAPFERRPYGTELALCQRYYQKSYAQSTVPGSSVTSSFNGLVWSNGVCDAGTGQVIPFTQVLPQTMRTTPTMSYWDAAGNVSKFSTFTGGAFARTDNQGGLSATYLNSDSLISGYGTPGVGNSFAFAYAISAEL